jgi:hypothetical protein
MPRESPLNPLTRVSTAILLQHCQLNPIQLRSTSPVVRPLYRMATTPDVMEEVRGRPISTTTARGGFGAAPGVPDKILGHKMAGAVVGDKIPAPEGPGILPTTTAPAILWPRILSGTPGEAQNTPGGGGGYISGP